MKVLSAFAPGKIILSGEYAVVFGYPGIAIPAPIGMHVTHEDPTKRTLEIVWPGVAKEWIGYVHDIIHLYEKQRGPVRGILKIRSDLPLGKGMGSSTALNIAIGRCLLGDDCMRQARSVEDHLTPGHSGIDFMTIWESKPIVYVKDKKPTHASLSLDFLKGALLVDTGTPHQTTNDLVAWVKGRHEECREALKHIGRCTERFLAGEDAKGLIADHHRAQIRLGVVPKKVQELIGAIEAVGSAAKVIGAGAITGSAGMVLAIGITADQLKKIAPKLPTITLKS